MATVVLAEADKCADVTVIVPCRNAAPYLPQMLASVAIQRPRPRACVLVDDGSTDGSRMLACEAGWLVLETGGTGQRGRGAAVARNLALEVSCTEYVAFLDADDWWEPNHLAGSLELLRRHPGSVVAFGRKRASDSGVLSPNAFRFPHSIPFNPYPDILAENFVPVSAAVARTCAVRDAGGFDGSERQRGVEDYGLWLRLGKLGDFIFRDAVALNYRVHPGQTSRNTRLMGEHALLLRRECLQRLRLDSGGRIDQTTNEAAANGWVESLDVLWHYGHLEAYSAWATEYASAFGKSAPGSRTRMGPVGRVHFVLRRLFGRVPP